MSVYYNVNFKLHLIAVAMLASIGSLGHAQTAVPSAGMSSQLSATETSAEPVAPGPGAGLLDRVFSDNNPSSSASQLSSTSSYELGGIGRREVPTEQSILTAPVVGLPLRMENGLFLYPTVSAGAGRNDNVLSTVIPPFSTAARSRTVTQPWPGAALG